MASDNRLEEFVQILMSWSYRNLRDFPWRRTKNPYLILIAEVMLQRTRAEQVVPVYVCFRRSFPKPQDLAEASENAILNCIQSLGLRKRASGLKRLAIQLVSDFEGRVPKTRKELIQLYGVGNYAANAVLSVAYEKNVPAIDANFARILKRVFSVETSAIPQKDENLALFANNLVPYVDGKFKIFNWTLIDFSNMICLPRTPKCPACPLKSICHYSAVILRKKRSGREISGD